MELQLIFSCDIRSQLADKVISNVKLTQGRMTRHNIYRRVGKVGFKETDSKVFMEANIEGNNIEIEYMWFHANIR